VGDEKSSRLYSSMLMFSFIIKAGRNLRKMDIKHGISPELGDD
jgi:hypothetical protein